MENSFIFLRIRFHFFINYIMKKGIFLVVVIVSVIVPISAQESRLICNPMNLNYRFHLEDVSGDSYREAADPSVVYHNNRYWLFASKSGGFWSSIDLIDWTFTPTTAIPIEEYAPDIQIVDNFFVYAANGQAGLYRTQDPMSQQWEEVLSSYGGGDKHHMQDDDGRVYKYWGLSPSRPIKGVEVNPNTFAEISSVADLMILHSEINGWEQRGNDHSSDSPSYLEGAWVNKYDGKYYLQYSSPGTQFNIYSDGVYVSDSPLGPYTIQRHNPYSYKPNGFMTGAGHGCSFYDIYQNFWHMTTMRVSLRGGFERRLGLFPAGFDEDGVLFCNTRFGDYPMNMPTSQWDPWQDSFAGLMLLSLNKPVTVSSVRNSRVAANAVDENVRTYWAGETKQNEWLEVDLGAKMSVAAFQVNLAEEACTQFGLGGNSLYVQYIIEGSENGSSWTTLVDKSDFNQDIPHDFVRISASAEIRYVKIKLLRMPGGGYCALSGFRVFGNKEGDSPVKVSTVRATRLEDSRRMDVSWNPVDGAHGYNVFYGIDPEKFYNCVQVYGQTMVQIPALSVNEGYWVSVEAFGETGVGDRSNLVDIPIE